jgi:hypothetical protein
VVVTVLNTQYTPPRTLPVIMISQNRDLEGFSGREKSASIIIGTVRALNMNERILLMIRGIGWGPERIWIGRPTRNTQNDIRKIRKNRIASDFESSINVK